MRLTTLCLATIAGFVFATSLLAQDATQTAPPAAGPTAESSSKSKASRSSGTHADDFLVRGTVFTPEGLAFPGAELRIRRTSDKNYKWRDSTNSRGDFAIRVKMGGEYEVVAHAKGFQDQMVKVDAKSGERFKDVVFRMERQEGKK